METQSLWQELSPPANFPSLDEDITADVAVVGGGITGITTALQLSRAGRKVALIEAHEIGCGTTGGSTGNLYATVDEHLFRIKEKWDPQTVRTIVQSRQAGIETIRKLVDDYQIDCRLAPGDWHLYATPDASEDALDAVDLEYAAAREAGLDASMVDALPLPFKIASAVKIRNQAQIDPLAYVRGLARGIAGTCQLFEHSPMTGIDAKAGIVRTAHGRIAADAIVLATHSPKGVYMVQTAMQPAREYGLAARLRNGGEYPEGIFWSADQPKHSIRSFDADGDRYLVVIGGKHQTGKLSDTAECHARLESFARGRFDVASIPFRWSAQHYRTGDMLPYIGRSAAARNVYIATGYASDGLVYGTLAASIIADAISGVDNPWRDAYKPTRFTPGKSARLFIRQNMEVTAELGRKIVGAGTEGWFDAVKPGEGRLLKTGGRKLAAYRDAQGKLTVVSGVCTHLHCDVHWNSAEKSWDCPCHGSRFSLDGSVIEGPAIAPLARQDVEAK